MEITPQNLSKIKQYVPGNFAVYRVDGTTVESLYFSSGLPAILGMTEKDYRETTQRNAAEVVFSEDLPGLMTAVKKSIDTNQPLDYRYRVIHKRSEESRVGKECRSR